jgi:phage terminase large subunit GpA-like protein
MVREYEDAKTSLPKMITFTNTKLGETYKVEGDSPAWENLYNRREPYKINTPHSSVVLLTSGVDIQKDRIELEIVGWAKGKQSYSVDFRVLLGNTDSIENPVWSELEKVLDETFYREDGAGLQVKLMAVDSGYNTSVVYEFARKHFGKVIPTKGQDNQALMVSPPRSVDTARSGKKINGVKVWNVGTSMIKTEFYGWLKLERKEDETYPAGYCHFPEYDRHYFKGVTAEKMGRKINKKGFTVYTWIKHFERNEPLDCRVYARAAANVVGMDRWTEKAWDKMYFDTLDNIEAESETKTLPKPKPKKGTDFWSRR